MHPDEVMRLVNETVGAHWMDEAHIQRFARALWAEAQRAAVPQWIACSERMPESFQPVLLIAVTGLTGLTPAVGDWNGREWQAWPYSTDPTHWMPLPPPPETQG